MLFRRKLRPPFSRTSFLPLKKQHIPYLAPVIRVICANYIHATLGKGSDPRMTLSYDELALSPYFFFCLQIISLHFVNFNSHSPMFSPISIWESEGKGNNYVSIATFLKRKTQRNCQAWTCNFRQNISFHSSHISLHTSDIWIWKKQRW